MTADQWINVFVGLCGGILGTLVGAGVSVWIFIWGRNEERRKERFGYYVQWIEAWREARKKGAAFFGNRENIGHEGRLELCRVWLEAGSRIGELAEHLKLLEPNANNRRLIELATISPATITLLHEMHDDAHTRDGIEKRFWAGIKESAAALQELKGNLAREAGVKPDLIDEVVEKLKIREGEESDTDLLTEARE